MSHSEPDMMNSLEENLFREISEWLALWHRFRVLTLIFTFSILIVVRTVARLRHNRQKLSGSPRPASPAHSLSSAEEKWENPVSGDPVSPNRKSALKSLPPKRVIGTKQTRSATAARVNGTNGSPTGPSRIQVLVFFSSLTGNTEKSATEFTRKLSASLKATALGSWEPLEPQLHDLSYIDYDDYFISSPASPNSHPNTEYFYLFLLPTYNIDTVLNTFTAHLQETHHDFRIDTAPLSSLLGYSVFGFGDRQGWPSEQEGFCSQALEVDKWMAKLTGKKRAFPLGMGDVSLDASERLDEWRSGIVEMLREAATNGGLGEGVVGSGDALESDEEDIDSGELVDGQTVPGDIGKSRTKRRRVVREAAVDDVEDLGRLLQKGAGDIVGELPNHAGPIAIDFTTYGKGPLSTTPPLKEMVPKSSPTYTALTKQGYTIVGSHSGVKICRWTKSALRGRGSCYKFSFYGIKSHLCMETTPSLSCSNKCVFCWRHGTNPVGTTWRWKVDPPEKIFEGVKDGHYRKIKMMRGVPGIRADRFAEAFRIRHCALSLVGEPIFYPYINEFAAMLHKEHISSFLVCNAQHPDQLAALKPVTQLYVSIDASNRESLRRIDRPLHRDFWERFQRCLDILREKRFRQRTVFRLTLVKGFNVEDEVQGYADLVEKGLPCFVEVKGVTYCGTSSSAGAGLTMQNVPFYEEVSEFVVALDRALRKRGLSYGIAAEHAHRTLSPAKEQETWQTRDGDNLTLASCCILLASTRFLINERWHTVIDYSKFFELLESGKEFAPEDYIGPPTPEWANWGNGGFDPADTRVYRKGGSKGSLRIGEGVTIGSGVLIGLNEDEGQDGGCG
ncbi:hypothetical protein FGG08_000148 [Glutinoglossum americanum]|uniref:tRNA 4-demethylwyosine synthase (AdoMet-dependent) n=1 Tax=Glutinoglossum americanum TaxID=1670608 RepID=A0A9P8IDR1_9PEZI|nr:hypothetical protein FGG08_000148 [Glutinoglossum americanum]